MRSRPTYPFDMILILCHLYDADAAWLCQRLQQTDPAIPTLIVSVDELLFAHDITHTLGHNGIDFSIKLQNGQCIDRNAISLVINRLYYLDPIIWKRADPKQYQYVAQEINALYLSLLYSVGSNRLYNPPTPVSLGGRHLITAEWQLLALRSGLPIPPGWPAPEATQPVLPDARLLVLDGHILGALPAGIAAEACRQLACKSESNLLEIHFAHLDAGYVFVGATVFAMLHHYGDELVNYFLNCITHGSDLGHTERIAHPALA